MEPIKRTPFFREDSFHSSTEYNVNLDKLMIVCDLLENREENCEEFMLDYCLFFLLTNFRQTENWITLQFSTW